MNKYLETINSLLLQNNLSQLDKEALLKAIAEADKQWTITNFKLERTEKLKKTTGILLEETITELELKRKAVEAQNRELEIEAALERVRAVAMSMNNAEDMLDVCKTISQQLIVLNVKEIRNVQTGIFYETKKNYTNFEYYAKHDKCLVTVVDYNNHPVAEKFATQMLKGPNEVFIYGFKGDEVKDWLAYQKTTNVFIDPHLETADTLNYYWYSLGPVALGISTYIPLTEDEVDLFKRFRNVFELAYRRYLDIENAAAQAKEAQIQLALERVRARTMAMQKSDELQDTTLVLFQQFKSLGATTSQVSICIFDEDTIIGEMFVTLNGEKIDRSFKMELDKETFVMVHAKKAFLDKQRRFSYVVTGTELKRYNHWRNELIGRKGWDESDKVIDQSWHVDGVCFSRGIMSISSDKPTNPEAVDLLERFGGVFDLTYTRFIDLQKAEAQAKEAQVQLALERVRARTMAMHHSSELAEVAALLFEQVKQLGVEAYTSGFNIWDDDHKNLVSWMGNPTGSINPAFEMPIHTYDQHSRLYAAWKNNESFMEDDLKDEALRKHYQFLWSFPLLEKAFRRSEQAGIKTPDRQVHNAAFFSKGFLLFITMEPCPEFHHLFQRFAGVFDQTYIRFLDLKKAEAQAREATIEAALERVRSRSLAMHKSDELSAIARTMFEQLRNLGLELEDGLIIMLFKQGSHDQLHWPVFEGIEMNDTMFRVPYFDHPVMNEVYKARDTGVRFIERHFDKTIKDDFLKKIFSITDYKDVPVEFQNKNLGGSCYHYSFAMERFTGILVQSYNRDNYPAEHNDIIIRFARVFEQAYVRFLDLQKAEGQAREARIEAALERVRARTMAMHNSNELAEAALVLFQQFRELELLTPHARPFFSLFNASAETSEIWTTKGDGSLRSMSHTVSFKENASLENVFKAWKEKQPSHVRNMTGKELTDYLNYLMTIPHLREEPILQQLMVTPPERIVVTDIFFTHGSIGVISFSPVSEEHKTIMYRFANAFGLTYTRFIDLKNAEAQAKEAQIEAALERVRSRAMAMQTSEELGALIGTVFTELTKLDLVLTRSVIWIFDEKTDGATWWMANSEDPEHPMACYLPYHDYEPYLAFLQQWKKRALQFQYELKGKVKEGWDEYIFSETGLAALPEVVKNGMKDEPLVWLSASFNNFGALNVASLQPLSKEHFDILLRFAKVFDLTYTRFNDLKQAEVQVREAKIEAALERVRSKAMAMHKTDDLNAAVAVVFEELEKLSLGMSRCGLGIINKERRTVDVYSTSISDQGVAIQISGDESMDIHPLLKGAFESWLDQKDFTYVLQGADLIDYYRAIGATNIKLPQLQAEAPTQYYQMHPFQAGGLFAFRDIPYTDEAKNVMKRFASVFNLTYKRFLDLRKAEEQARESQIQLALERVRARTMAMQHSNELAETAAVLFEQFYALGEMPERMAIEIVNEEERVFDIWATEHGGKQMNLLLKASLDEPHVMKKMYKAWKEHEKSITIDLQGKDLEEYFQFLNKEGLPVDRIKFGKRRVQNVATFSKGILTIITPEPRPQEAIDILERFASVFDGTYTRFLDLQKAELQAREAKIEAGLERVRARTMAMHTSDDVSAATATMFSELEKLGIQNLRGGITIISPDQKQEVWSVTNLPDGRTIRAIGVFDMRQHPLWQQLFEAKKKNESYHYYWLAGKDKEDYVAILNTTPNYLAQPIKNVPDVHVQSYFFGEGAIWTNSLEPHTEEEKQIMKRFASVFKLTFRRYLDLQKAEAQAREAQIEASLERVRSSAMAMHNSNDISATTNAIFAELKKLGIQSTRCGVALLAKNSRIGDIYAAATSSNGEAHTLRRSVELTQHPSQVQQYESWLKQENYISILSGEELKSYYQLPFFNSSESYNPPENYDRKEYGHYIPFSEGLFYAWSDKLYSESETNILNRFKNIIDLTFRRFLDLQKAEAQAREAQIEAALERVRSKTMAMHNSNDVGETVATMFDELVKLSVDTVRCGIAILQDNRKMEAWTAMPEGDKLTLTIGHLDTSIHPMLSYVYNAWKNKDPFTSYDLIGQDLKDYFTAINNSAGYPIRYDIDKLPYRQMNSAFYFPEGCLFAFTNDKIPAESASILKRFAAVFGQTYRRYLDLLKAEEQAKEAQIEAALERVRGKAMAMHNSNDLSATASIVFTELRKLGITPIRCGVGLLNKETRKGQLYTNTSTAEGDSLALVGWVELSGHPVLNNIFDTWLKNEDYFPELSGEQLKSYYELLLKGLAVKPPDWEGHQKQYGTFLSFSVGCLYAWSQSPYSDAEIKILKRFASIIDLTFRRYIELQKSEANAKEAVKQAALDRIRADIASMRTINDLDRITPLIWNELTILGIPFIRCGVFIMDDSQQVIHTFLSTPHGKAIAAFHIPYNTPGNITDVLEHWHDKKIYTAHWEEKEFIEFAAIITRQGGLNSPDQYLKTIPHEGFHLHFLPFLQGMLYVGNTTQLADEDIQLIQSVAEAFSTAYARYEDFNKLEAAKQQVEKTLVDLKQTQQQLVQSEKMASLGELTAGIAHEIQNPLNFVNNFSDVSNELLDEMKEELEKGNINDALSIARDVKQNLEKINHHGKRADGIVKGMLQHSRTSSGQKELTDINALADEYLRLAYHGLRAKDKSFNAKFETDFDNTVGKINIIPQEMGRVMLNMINNSFYAVSEKKRTENRKYEPTVIVTTKKAANKILISVKDNGNGIPQKIVDKIFQPFFTTKPTGQGTGLGLSLAYDIITKGHGGELKVETREGEGTEFIIQLSV